MKYIQSFESLNEAKKSTIHRAAKKGSYPAVIVVVQDGKVIHQEPVSTPDIAPATFNVMQEKYPKALLHLEDNTGKRLFSESVVTEGEDTIGGLNKMANTDLERIADYADMIKDRMSQGQQLDAWMYSKISDSVKNLNSVHVTMDGNDGINEAKFFRLPKQLNAMWELKNSVDYIVSRHDAGNDYKPEEMKTIEEFIKKIKQSAKAFKDAGEVKGTVYESVVNEAAKIETERYVRSHGKKPTGYGGWMFSYNRDGSDEWQIPNGMSWPDAQKWAKKKAKEDGEDYVYVMENESVNEAKFTKRSLMKAMKKDDGMIQLSNGQEYVIYNPNNGNDDNADMWKDKVIFGLDQDGEEHEIEYSDIVRYDESVVNEAMDINDPVLMAFRATRAIMELPKFKPAEVKSRRISFDKYMDLLDSQTDIGQDIKDKAEAMAQTLRDMEQEAEPDGGVMADKYGSIMMKQEKEYTQLKAKKAKIDASVEKYRMS